MLKQLDLPEEITGERCNAIRRNHNFDQQMFISITKNRSLIGRYLPWVEKTSNLEDVQKATDLISEDWDNGSDYSYIIKTKEEQFAGCVSVLNIDYKNMNAEFGYWLDIDFVSKGFVSDILKSLENLLFQKNFARLVIKCDITNSPSNNVALRNGYKLEGVCKKAERRGLKFFDINQYSKINPHID